MMKRRRRGRRGKRERKGSIRELMKSIKGGQENNKREVIKIRRRENNNNKSQAVKGRIKGGRTGIGEGRNKGRIKDG